MERQNRFDAAIANLGSAMESILEDAKVNILGPHQMDIHFGGLPNSKISVVRRFINSERQLFETRTDLQLNALASATMSELRHLAACENIGLRGVSVLPIYPVLNQNRGGLRVRASFAGTDGTSKDETENLAIDILTVLAFARTLEDRIAANSVEDRFSFDLYNSQFDDTNYIPITRYVTTGEPVFEGSQDRVFSEVMKAFSEDNQSKIQIQPRPNGERSASIQVIGTPLLVVARIPDEIPVFVAHAPLLRIENISAVGILEMLNDLNAHGEIGHFEADPISQILSFTTWKHLTNDMNRFSFDHTIQTMTMALNLAQESLSFYQSRHPRTSNSKVVDLAQARRNRTTSSTRAA